MADDVGTENGLRPIKSAGLSCRNGKPDPSGVWRRAPTLSYISVGVWESKSDLKLFCFAAKARRIETNILKKAWKGEPKGERKTVI